MIKILIRRFRNGFSLLEISIVIFIMGVTITALLQLLELGYLRYNLISSDLVIKSVMTEARVWLREKITKSEIEDINIDNLLKSIHLPRNFRFSQLKLSNYDSETYFVQLQIFEDRNKNGKLEITENSDRKLFCFRRRTHET